MAEARLARDGAIMLCITASADLSISDMSY